jgi:hypothetical protein
MATKLAPAHREIDGQPVKTTDVARVPARKRPRADARPPAHTGACPYPACACEEED